MTPRVTVSVPTEIQDPLAGFPHHQSIHLQVTQAEFDALQAAAERNGKDLAEYCRDSLLESLRQAGAPTALPDVDFGKLEREFWEREQLEERLNAEIAGFAKASDRLTYRDCLRLRELRMDGACSDFYDLWKSKGIYAVKAEISRK